jgi:VanZ family protein
MASPPGSRRRDRAIDVLLWAMAALSAALTLWLSLGPVPTGVGAFPGGDKGSHGVAYFVTTLLLLFAAVWRPGRGPGPLAGLGRGLVAAIVLWGLSVELLQTALTTRRQAELTDWLADAAGALAAALVHGGVRRVVSGPQRHSATSGFERESSESPVGEGSSAGSGV